MKTDKNKVSLKDVWYYVQGNIRYHLYYSNYFNFLIRKHIKLQIDERIKVMNKDCYLSGSCIKCGCRTTELQMANKPCAGACYGKMKNKKEFYNSKR